MNWPQSFLDFFVWYYEPLIARSGFNGTWWDNCYAGTISEYDPETNRLESIWNLYSRRQLCKRLNVVGWKNMRPPFWALNDQTEIPWNQLFWTVEGIWQEDGKDITATQKFSGVDKFRAAARLKSSMLVVEPTALARYKGTTPEKDLIVQRNVDGMLLSHDIAPCHDKELLRKLEYYLDYSNEDECLFSGYWQLDGNSQSDLKVSAYSSPTRSAWAFVLLNAGRQAGSVSKINTGFLPGWTQKGPGSGGAWKLLDLESGEEVACTFGKNSIELSKDLALAEGSAHYLVAVPQNSFSIER
jgi:hypothetical protein